MSAYRHFKFLLAVCAMFALAGPTVRADDPPAAQQPAATVERWTVTVGKSLVIDSPLPIDRLSVADGSLADAVAIGPREVLINGKAPGETSLIVWQKAGSRLIYDLVVRMSPIRLEAVRQQIAREYPEDEISITYDNDTVFVRGAVKDVVAADRVMAIANSLGKAVNLLNVDVPPVEAQISVKVRFANVDRTATKDLAVNLASGAFNQTTALTLSNPLSIDGAKSFSLSDAINFLLFRKDIDLVATLKAMESKNLLEMLAEPTVPAINGRQAFFTAGGEFPFPIAQPGTNGGTITLSWREYGVRLNFLPVITPRGTIRLRVEPEVSSLDYAHAVTVQGLTVPGLATRRVQTEIELESGQSFVIAGLIDNQASESFSKIRGIGDIPVLGKLFQSKNVTHTNNELLVIVTPEVVRPIPAGQALPELNYPQKFLPPNSDVVLRHPGMDKTGPVPVTPPTKTIPIEPRLEPQKQGQPDAAPNAPNAPAALRQYGPAQQQAPAQQPPPPGGGGGGK